MDEFYGSVVHVWIVCVCLAIHKDTKILVMCGRGGGLWIFEWFEMVLASKIASPKAGGRRGKTGGMQILAFAFPSVVINLIAKSRHARGLPVHVGVTVLAAILWMTQSQSDKFHGRRRGVCVHKGPHDQPILMFPML